MLDNKGHLLLFALPLTRSERFVFCMNSTQFVLLLLLLQVTSSCCCCSSTLLLNVMSKCTSYLFNRIFINNKMKQQKQQHQIKLNTKEY